MALSATLVAFAACDKVPTTKVSTYAELLNAEGNVVLTDDIDCNFGVVSTLNFDSFDGQDHKIKNFIIKATGVTDNAAFFSADTQSIKNVTFEGVKAEGINVLALSIVKIGGGGKIENVHVKSAEIKVTQNDKLPCFVGAIYAGAYNEHVGKTSEVYESPDANLMGCSVDNVTIKVEGTTSTTKIRHDVNVGAIAGVCDNVSNSYATNCNLTVNSNSTASGVIVGGLVGISDGSIVNSYSANNTLNVNAIGIDYSTGYTEANLCVGGLVGYMYYNHFYHITYDLEKELSSSKIQCCYAEQNTITARTNGKINAGGLAGHLWGTQVGQCYAVNNEITDGNVGFLSYNVWSYENMARSLCGLVGYAERALITSSFTCNNVISESSEPYYDCVIAACGLSIVDDATSVSYCATYNNTLTADCTDEFSCLPIANAYYCLVTSQASGNVNACQIVNSSFWSNANSLKKQLKIGGLYWTFAPNKLPTLEF